MKMYIPTVIDSSGKGERAYDIYSRLLKERIVFLSDEVNEETATSVVAQLLYLESVDPGTDISAICHCPQRVRRKPLCLTLIACIWLLRAAAFIKSSSSRH